MHAEEAIQRTREVIRRQHKALATEEIYVHWLRRYISALQGTPPTLTSEQKLERFLTQLASHETSPPVPKTKRSTPSPSSTRTSWELRCMT